MLQYLPAAHMEKLTDERSRDLQIILNYIAYVQRIDGADNWSLTLCLFQS